MGEVATTAAAACIGMGAKIGCDVGHYDYDAYAIIDNAIVRPRHKQSKILAEK